MTKYMTAGFGGLTLLISYYSIVVNSTILTYVMDTQQIATILRSLFVIFIVSYCFSALLRNRISRFFMVGLSLLLIYFGLSTLASFDIALLDSYYVKPLDIFFAIEWGILGILVSIERPIRSNRELEIIDDKTDNKTIPRLRINTA